MRIISGLTEIKSRHDEDTCKWRQEQRRLQKEGWQVPAGHLELGSEHSVTFAKEVLHAKEWYIQTVVAGYQPRLCETVHSYTERNNKSARENMDFVRGKVDTWQKQGYVTKCLKPAFCNNPLTVSEKLDTGTGQIKQRLCLDVSRHVNQCVDQWEVNMEDLKATEAMWERGAYMGVFDLENMFFHVKLEESVKQFFGFTVEQPDGTPEYFVFNVMPFGYSPAVAVVNRLLKPVVAYLHQLGIRVAIYVDDGQVVAKSQLETRGQYRFVLDILQHVGWNIQWAKTDGTVKQVQRYLGVEVDLDSMRYWAPADKMEEVSSLANGLVASSRKMEPVPCRLVAKVIGKVVALRASHGNILTIRTRTIQHELGLCTERNGWEASMQIGVVSREELAWVRDHVQRFNGRQIRDERRAFVVVRDSERLSYLAQSATQNQDVLNSNVMGATSFVRNGKGKYEQEQEVDVQDQINGAGAYAAELRAIIQAVSTKSSLQGGTGTVMWWVSPLRGIEKLLRSSVRENICIELSTKLAELELSTGWEVKAKYYYNDMGAIAISDWAHKLSTSTDEWGPEPKEMKAVLDNWGVHITVDALASSDNHYCQRFFSRTLQQGAQDVQFFMQQLQESEVYYCCPPVKLVGHVINKLAGCTRVEAVLVVPHWQGATFWPMLMDEGGFRKEIRRWWWGKMQCRDTRGRSSIFTEKLMSDVWIGHWKSGDRI